MTSLVDLPEYIISSFLPGAQPLLTRYPRLFKLLGVILALWYFGPLARLQALWSRFSSILVATINVSSEEDLFNYLVTYLIDRKTFRADQTLNAISNPPQQEGNRRGPPGPFMIEETNRRTRNEEIKIKYEQDQGVQVFVHKRRIFWAKRALGEGHTYSANRYKRAEVLSISCLGRSAEPIKALLEEIFKTNKDKERNLTIIRRPYGQGFGSRLNWSRLTSKPRRKLDTVILEEKQKNAVLADIDEYMSEETSTFYGNHGIPYRRGYLFHGPPGVGKTSFALALASRFNLDVYVLTLLDHDLTDSDLMSLLNQLPGRSLLLLEDIDTAGLSNRNKGKGSSSIRRLGRRRHPMMPPMASGGDKKGDKKEGVVESDDDEPGQTSRVSLSGLLNAIDGVAAPEGHILIMTTNKPYELDDALVRAGRISVRVGFTNASKEQAKEIFRRMYVDLPSQGFDNETMSVGLENVGSTEKVEQSNQDKAHEEQLEDLAKQFADILPEDEYSPADLQDYLLVHKKDPARAVSGLEDWMKGKKEEERRKESDEVVEKEARKVERGKDKKIKDLEDEIAKEGAEGAADEGAGDAANLVEGGKDVDGDSEKKPETTETTETTDTT